MLSQQRKAFWLILSFTLLVALVGTEFPNFTLVTLFLFGVSFVVSSWMRKSVLECLIDLLVDAARFIRRRRHGA